MIIIRNIAFTLFFLSLSFLSLSQNLENLKTNKAFYFHSGINLQGQYYGVEGIDPRSETLSYMISGNPVIGIYGFSIPLYFALSNQHRQVQQPLNHFGIKPFYKWAKFHAGYNSVRFSPFTLDGHRFLGVGTELNPGKLRLGAVYGRFKKAINEDTTALYDPSKYISPVPVPSYSRKGYAFKLGVGTKKNHVDLILFKANDDENSIERPTKFHLLPAENAVLGLSSNFQLMKKLAWTLDLGVSANTRNTNTDSLNTEDWNPGLEKALRVILIPKESTQLSFAGETSLAYRTRNFSMKLLYRRVDPEYQSMGVYYLQKDMEQYSISPSISFWKRMIRLSGTFGIQRNNICQTKSATTKRVIGSANFSFNPGKMFSLTMNYSNYGITQNPQSISISDTTLLEQVSQNFTIGPRLTLSNKAFVHTLFLYGNYVELSDRSESIIYQAQMNSKSANLTYNLNWIKQKSSLNASLIFRSIETVAGEIGSIGMNAGVSKRLIAEKYSISLNYSYFSNAYSGGNRGSTHQIRGQGSIVIFENNQLFMQGYYLKNNSENELLSRAFSEYSVVLGCNLIFSNR